MEKAVELTNKLAYYDSLTGLPNYNYFMDYLKKFVNDEEKTGIVLITSLKNLNVINAVYGNENGNQMLLKTGEALKAIQREDIFVARVSSNEFAICISGTREKHEIESKIHSILCVINSHNEEENIHHNVEFFISFSKIEPGKDSFEDCYQKAQIALTYAKYMNSDELVAYDEAFDQKMKRFSDLKELLKRQIDDWCHIRLYYQPQFENETDSIVSVEALSRWHTDVYGEISPLEFIPIIEELHLHEKFGLAVIEKALIEYPELRKKYGIDTTISINISPACLVSHSFADHIVRLLKEYNFLPSMLTLEITEDLVIEGVDAVNRKLTPLRSMGVKISLDDFGTGFSSLSYLPRLEVDEIKIDKSLIDQIVISEKSRILIQSLIILSKEYKLTIVAEGVESATQFELLKKMGCTLIQGYYIGRAEPI